MIAALLGQRERAAGLLRDLLRQETKRGSLWWWLHDNLNGDLESLRDTFRDDPFVGPLVRMGDPKSYRAGSR
jgi:hypothetical protein